MGFLLGAFGKLAAGRRYRQLQAKMMRVQSRLRRATRQAADMEKSIDRQEKMALNNLTMQQNAIKGYTQDGLASSNPLIQSAMSKLGIGVGQLTGDLTNSQLSAEEKAAFSQYQSSISNMNSQLEMSVAFQKQQISDYYEQLRDQMLEPLKDEEDLLQSEKDSLESQIQVAKTDYEACQKMEQSDAKLMAPNYTGGQ